MISHAASPEVPRNRPNDAAPERAPKMGEDLKRARENVNAFQKLRQVVLQEKTPVVNATEDDLQTTAVTINARNERARKVAPDFYQAA